MGNGADADIRESLLKMFAKDYENVRELFNTMNDGLLITDHQLEIIAVNPSFEKITGYKFAEVYKQTPKLLQSGKTKREVFQEMWSCIKEKGTWTGELINRRKNGEEFYSYITITHIKKDPIEASYYIGIMRDITERKRTLETISYLAYHDQLTHLPNRTSFTRQMAEYIERLNGNKAKLAVFFLDLDRFKNVNDTLGHQAGDELLLKVANRLKLVIGDRGIVSRFGGDEFCIFLHTVSSEKDIYQMAEAIIESFTNPFECAEQKLYITCSMEISLFPEHGTDAQSLIKLADTAMYRSKDESRNNYQFYHYTMDEGAAERLQLENELYEAIKENQFEVYYQIQVDTDTKRPYGAEALIRWNHPEKGMLSPALFLKVAEETGLIRKLDEWVLKTACKQAKEWHDKGFSDLIISVNISQHLFERNHFVPLVKEILAETKLDPTKLCIEITENTAILDVLRAIDKFKELRKLGIKISLDDFGTGYSSLSQIKNFPLDMIKIDQSFVKALNEQRESEAIVRLIIEMAKNLKFSVICEGVETVAQKRFIRKEGCKHMQGYLFSKPVPSSQCEQIIAKMLENHKENM